WSADRIRRRLLGGGGQRELGKTLSEVPRRRRQGPDENGPAERREGLHRSKGAGGIKGRERHQDHQGRHRRKGQKENGSVQRQAYGRRNQSADGLHPGVQKISHPRSGTIS